MSKTPYELRYELLLLAQNILSEEMMGERMRLENDWGLLREAASIRMSQNLDQATRTNARFICVELPPFPKMPSLDAQSIINMAEALNKFVSKND